MRRRNGFTLLELMVVVAIIVVLIAIILPSLGAAKGVARRAVCAANQRSIGQGLAMVITDGAPNLTPGYFPSIDGVDTNDRYFTWYLLVGEKLGVTQPAVNPQITWSQEVWSTGPTWRCDLSPMAKMFVCPDDPAPVATIIGPQLTAWNHLSYGYNDWPLGSFITPPDRRYMGTGQTQPRMFQNNWQWTTAQIQQRIVVVTDSREGTPQAAQQPLFNYQIDLSVEGMPGIRHQNGTNALFADWHVEWVGSQHITWGPVHPNPDGYPHPLQSPLVPGQQSGVAVQ